MAASSKPVWVAFLGLVALSGCYERDSDGIQRVNLPTAGYGWRSSDWTQCSKTCSAGVQSRVVVCVDERSQHVAPDANCVGARPETTQQCNTEACADSYSWNVGDWTQCSKTCSDGVQSRVVVCVDERSQRPVNASKCAASRPAATQQCNPSACS